MTAIFAHVTVLLCKQKVVYLACSS